MVGFPFFFWELLGVKAILPNLVGDLGNLGGGGFRVLIIYI